VEGSKALALKGRGACVAQAGAVAWHDVCLLAGQVQVSEEGLHIRLCIVILQAV